MNVWEMNTRLREEFELRGDRERVRMADLCNHALDVAEENPDKACSMMLEGRRLAEQLGEPWWVFFYEVWYAYAVMDHKLDYSEILDDVVACAVKAQRPEFLDHPWRIAAMNALLNAYLAIDPVGYADEVHKALVYVDSILPPGPGDDRFVLTKKKIQYNQELGHLDKALALSLGYVKLTDEHGCSPWYQCQAYFLLAWTYYYRREWEELQGILGPIEDLTRVPRNRMAPNLVQVLLMKASLLRRAGQSQEAQQAFQEANFRQARLGEVPTSEFYEVKAHYQVLGGELEAGLQTRVDEIATLTGRGMLVDECKAHVQRCRLLRQLGRLTDEALEQAREAARKLRKPEQPLATIQGIADGSDVWEDVLN